MILLKLYFIVIYSVYFQEVVSNKFIRTSGSKVFLSREPQQFSIKNTRNKMVKNIVSKNKYLTRTIKIRRNAKMQNKKKVFKWNQNMKLLYVSDNHIAIRKGDYCLEKDKKNFLTFKLCKRNQALEFRMCKRPSCIDVINKSKYDKYINNFYNSHYNHSSSSESSSNSSSSDSCSSSSSSSSGIFGIRKYMRHKGRKIGRSLGRGINRTKRYASRKYGKFKRMFDSSSSSDISHSGGNIGRKMSRIEKYLKALCRGKCNNYNHNNYNNYNNYNNLDDSDNCDNNYNYNNCYNGNSNCYNTNSNCYNTNSNYWNPNQMCGNSFINLC
ncbi:hypothetical protein EHP00_2224 [Ecytonucleospora hepatopenaei]|uniref:Uncharacterized protein n=1 Tax=Ecytonucleospora hepatopenaei TaxID=646526 RepID=A0A1W0E4F2_9MICR|nr:hypothetical protein EHP00_2224 [Ecytonucleospora hepatopenaei]